MAPNNIYGATYPKVSIDERINNPNAQFNTKRISVEEWNDLLHHTHKLSEILGGENSEAGNITAEDLVELKKQVAELTALLTDTTTEELLTILSEPQDTTDEP